MEKRDFQELWRELEKQGYQKKLEWLKDKVKENQRDLRVLLKLFGWFSKQPELSIKERAVVGALMRRLENVLYSLRRGLP
jgi:hypothetical protein